jgi:hypothetical protein
VVLRALRDYFCARRPHGAPCRALTRIVERLEGRRR